MGRELGQPVSSKPGESTKKLSFLVDSFGGQSEVFCLFTRQKSPILSLYKTDISYYVPFQHKNSYIVSLENKRSLFSRDNRNQKNYSKKMPHPKIGLLAKSRVRPPANSHMFQTPTIQIQKFLHYHGMANNFRQVLNCVALLCCEIEEM